MNTDALSGVLSAVHLSGSVFFDVIAKSPWVAEKPAAAKVVHNVAPGAQHAMEYHVITGGSCWISLLGENASDAVKLDQGDIVVVPHGDPHVVSSAPGMRATEVSTFTADLKTTAHHPLCCELAGTARVIPD